MYKRHTLACYKGKYISKGKLAEEACEVEIEKLGAPIGKQDQYAVSFGGLNFISFHKDDTVSVEPVIAKGETIRSLQENIVMFYTGLTHDANQILSEQKQNLKKRDKTKNLIRMCELAKDLKISLEQNELKDFGDILNESWIKKRELAVSISNPLIDEMYECAMQSGALGGKLLGAGGGGFLLFYCPRERQTLLKEKLRLKPFDFRFEHDGTSVVYIGDKYWGEI